MASLAESCLVGSLRSYLTEGGGINNSPANWNYESMSPFVEVKIGSLQSPMITVGLKPYPNNPHKATVKSLEFGFIDEPQFVLEIIDEEGGRMGAIVDAMKDSLEMNFSGTGCEIFLRFGWIVSDCYGSYRKIPSNIFRNTILNLDVTYAKGYALYKISGAALGPVFADIREDHIFGENDKKIEIEEAINRLCNLKPIIKVRYVELQQDGKFKNVKFEWERIKPKGSWQADNQNRIATITKWLENYRIKDGTKEGAGIIPIFTPGTYDELCLLKDPVPKDGKNSSGANRLGVYIVNGGKCSTVIDFSPTFNFIRGTANFSAGGNSAGPGGSKGVLAEDAKSQPEKEHGSTSRGGMQQESTIGQQAWDNYGPTEAWEESMRSQQAHARAGRLTEVGIDAINGDLRIIGDPTLWDGQNPVQGKFVSIVSINPFYLDGSGCGDWLVKPTCNEILSNKNWLINGINHSIQPGNFTTTLKVNLAAPGVDISKNSPLGGSGGQGEVGGGGGGGGGGGF